MTGGGHRARRGVVVGAAHLTALVSLAALWLWLAAAPAPADVFNGRIAFSSVRSDPKERSFDIFSMNPDGTGVRRLTVNPESDRQADWSPGGTAIAYTIDKPDATKNFEVARMTATGIDVLRLTKTVADQASSQPSWLPDGSGMLFRRSGPTSRTGSIWQMDPFGANPALRFAPPAPPLYPTMAPDASRVLYAAILSPTGDTDRAIFAQNADGGGLRMLFDVAGAYDSAPAWSPDGARIAFESNADVGGANPERDMEVWVMDADGANPTQLTRNTAHDEGPAWSPDGRLLAYTSGPDVRHGDIRVMTAAGRDLRRLTTYRGADESPDWQAIPAPRTDRRCGDAARTGRGAFDVRGAGRGLSCRQARALA
ncbi:MAG: TolB family protein, partial [Solirubrobacteraceae bacterium]